MKALTVTTPTDREIVMTRSFDAPRQLVWDAMQKPELLLRWLSGPPGWEMTACENDIRAGGKYRWAWRGPAGEEMCLSGEYREVVPPIRGVRTERMEMGCVPIPGEMVGTLELAEQGKTTQMTLTLVYPSKEARDGALASGMEHGMNAGYANLDALLASQK